MRKIIIAVTTALLAILIITACSTNGNESVAESADSSSSIESNDNQNATSNDTESNESSEADVSDIVSEADESSESEVSIGDIDSQIKGYFDIIFANDNPDKYESEIAEEFSDEFAAIVAFGEDAFPALDEIINDSKSSIKKSAFAKYVKYNIKPELYDLVFTSPDEKFVAKAVPDTFLMMDSAYGIFYHIELIDCETDSIILTINESLTHVSAAWSQDSRYVSISNGSRYGGITDIIDVQEVKVIKLPDATEIESIIQEKFNNSYDIYNGLYFFSYNEWVSENKIKIGVILVNYIPKKAYEGWYIYDLSENKIIEENIQEVEDN